MAGAGLVGKRRAERFRVLEVIYEMSDDYDDTRLAIEVTDLDHLVGESLSAISLEKALNYMVSEGLLDSPYAEGTTYTLTHKGVVEYERAVTIPEAPTHYFPAVMTINNTTHSTSVATMVGSQIQQGTHGSTQSMTATLSGDAIVAIKAVLLAFEGHVATVPLEEEKRQELEADLNALRAQIASPKPKASILAECLKSARSIVEGVASSALGTAVLPQISIALAAIGLP